MKLITALFIIILNTQLLNAQWDGIGPWRADKITDISISKYPGGGKVIYAADSSENSLFKSIDEAESWSALPGASPLRVVSVPNDPDIVYKLVPIAEGGVLKSTDGGSSWSAVNNGLTNLYTVSIAMSPDDPNKLYVGCLEAGSDFVLYKTENGGGSWDADVSFRSPFADITDIEFDPADSLIIYVTALYNSSSGKGGVYQTLDDGENWVAKNTGLSNLDIAAIAVDPTDNSRLISGSSGNPGDPDLFIFISL